MRMLLRRSLICFAVAFCLVTIFMPKSWSQDAPPPAGDIPPAEAPADPAGDPPAGDPPAAPAPAAEEAAPPAGPIRMDLLKEDGADLGSTFGQKLQSLLGMVFLVGVCVLFSNNRKRISWKLVAWGLGLQLILGIFVMKTAAGNKLFAFLNDVVMALLASTTEGARFCFGKLAEQGNMPVGPGGIFGPVGSTGNMAEIGAYFAFGVLPTIIFFSSLMAVLYHLGFMQWVVKGVAAIMQKTMGTSGSETLSAAGNIFVGQTEAPLLVRPFVKGMTESELMAIMTGGFATVAGGVMAAYVGMLSGLFSGIAGHLISASVMSAPAALVIAKILIPEPVPEKSETYGELKLELKKIDANAIDAAARGAGDGLKLALNVGAMVLAFIALIAMFNSIINYGTNTVADMVYGSTWESRVAEAKADLADLEKQALPSAASVNAVHGRFVALAREALAVGEDVRVVFDPARADAAKDASGAITFGPSALDGANPAVTGIEPAFTSASPYRGGVKEPTAEATWRNATLQWLLGVILAPLAWLMGVPWEDASNVGQLLGIKTVVNEFVAYISLSGMIGGEAGLQHPRSVIIATYALCGFANFGSIAIQIGGIGGIAPERRSDLARLGMKAMIGGTIAALLTATVAGLLV
jgi:CNT family concentrative nucleoside transporter